MCVLFKKKTFIFVFSMKKNLFSYYYANVVIYYGAKGIYCRIFPFTLRPGFSVSFRRFVLFNGTFFLPPFIPSAIFDIPNVCFCSFCIPSSALFSNFVYTLDANKYTCFQPKNKTECLQFKSGSQKEIGE